MDIKTFIFVIGAGNLVFALLVSLYIRSSPTNHPALYHPALSLWRLAKVLSGVGFLLTLTRAELPALISMALANSLQIISFGLELAAYCLFLGHRRWLKRLRLLLPLAVMLVLAAMYLSATRNLALIAISSIGALFYGLMAYLFLSSRGGDLWLKRFIGGIDAAGAIVLGLRAARGSFFESLIPFSNDLINLALYLLACLAMLVNGFGFLLLVKQQDDRKLKKALQHLANAEAEQRQLLSIAAHEFRTPAAMIQTSLDSLRFLEGQIAPAVATRLDNIRTASQRLNQLANTLITQDLRLEQALAPQTEPVHLPALLSELVASYPAETALQLILPVVPDPAADPATFAVDPVLLRIALHNLLDNALEHNRPALGPVTLALRHQDAAMLIEVADHGHGIADPDKAQLFKRFYSARNTPGRGIGLSIVQAIAHAHGGEVTAENRQAQGCVFTLRLPYG